MKLRSRCASGFVALFLAAVASVPMVSQAAASESAQRKASLTAAEEKLLNSGAPKTVTLDPGTGAVLAVEKDDSRIEPLISRDNICRTGNACWYTTRIPYAHFGFYGSAGTYSATMPYRGDYHTGSYRASACWTYTQPVCSQPLPPNTHASLGGVTVTGTSFTIH